MERERKFLVAQAPAGLKKHPHQAIRQGYLAIPGRHDRLPVEVRLRDRGGKHSLTVKAGRGASRTEVELPLPANAFHTLWRLTAGKRIAKVRYRIPHDSLTIELDVYGGKLRGLMTAEVEFASNGQMHRFRPPDWLGYEVTGRDEFANNRLATRTAPPRRR